MSGYVAILTGRARATEDVDIVSERLDEERADRLVDARKREGYRGVAMPLDEMCSMLRDDDRIRVADAGELIPNFETWFAHDDVEREALSESIDSRSRTNSDSHNMQRAPPGSTSRDYRRSDSVTR